MSYLNALAAAVLEHLRDMEVTGYSPTTLDGRRRHLVQFAAWCEARGVTHPPEITSGAAGALPPRPLPPPAGGRAGALLVHAGRQARLGQAALPVAGAHPAHPLHPGRGPRAPPPAAAHPRLRALGRRGRGGARRT